MFNKNEFNAMVVAKGMNKAELASKLNIDRSTLYYRIREGGNFTVEEITKLIEIFGSEKVFEVLFGC